MKSYHGPTPVTADDIQMAKDHLTRTLLLNQEKIKDHKKAMRKAITGDNKASFSYNKAHLMGHQKDNEQIKRSMKTVKTLSPKTYDDTRKEAVNAMSKRVR